jgi:hypothetical protein
MYCAECDCKISMDVFNYSTNNFGVVLCRGHQNWVKRLVAQRITTSEAMSLYLALKDAGVLAELEKDDGYKCVDIVIEEAKIHIEVDGQHHNYNSRQALSDLRRTYHSFKKGYFTLRIPNSLIHNDFENTVDCILDVLETGRKKSSKPFSFLNLFRQ